MTLRVAQFFLKIAHLSFSMGPRGPRAYGLRPRLWLLISNNSYYPKYCTSLFPTWVNALTRFDDAATLSNLSICIELFQFFKNVVGFQSLEVTRQDQKLVWVADHLLWFGCKFTAVTAIEWVSESTINTCLCDLSPVGVSHSLSLVNL